MAWHPLCPPSNSSRRYRIRPSRVSPSRWRAPAVFLARLSVPWRAAPYGQPAGVPHHRRGHGRPARLMVWSWQPSARAMCRTASWPRSPRLGTEPHLRRRRRGPDPQLRERGVGEHRHPARPRRTRRTGRRAIMAGPRCSPATVSSRTSRPDGCAPLPAAGTSPRPVCNACPTPGHVSASPGRSQRSGSGAVDAGDSFTRSSAKTSLPNSVPRNGLPATGGQQGGSGSGS